MTSHACTMFGTPVYIPFISRQYSGSSFVLIDFVIGSQNQIWLSFSPSSFSGHVITSVSGSATFPATSKTRPLRRLCILKYLPSGMTAFVGYSSLLLYEQIPRNMKYSCECNPFEWFDALKCLVVAKLNQCRVFWLGLFVRQRLEWFKSMNLPFDVKTAVLSQKDYSTLLTNHFYTLLPWTATGNGHYTYTHNYANQR